MTDLAISPVDARTLTDRIKVALEATWQLVAEAYQCRAWTALGYDSWDDYVTREFGTNRIRLPREERQEVVASLRDAGMTTREIGSATGLSHTQVRRDLSGGTFVPSDSAPLRPNFQTAVDVTEQLDDDPDDDPPAGGQVIGLDGKRYPSERPAQPRWTKTPEQQQAEEDAAEIRRIAHGIQQLVTGWIRFKQLREQPHKKEAVMTALNDHDRAAFAEIDRSVTWAA